MEIIKVKEVKTHKISDKRKVPVVEGKLVLITQEKYSDGCVVLKREPDLSPKEDGDDYDIYKPIIISETEKIGIEREQAQGHVYDTIHNKIRQVSWSDLSDMLSIEGTVFDENNQSLLQMGDYYRILSLPEHFTPEQVQAIADGEMKDGDRVLVECEFAYIECHNYNGDHVGKDCSCKSGDFRDVYKIKQPLTLHEIEDSWDDILTPIVLAKLTTVRKTMTENEYKLVNEVTSNWIEWLKENYHSPKQKQ